MGARVIILTDGEENVAPYVSDITSDIENAGIVVDCILLTQNAADSLKTLCDRTGKDSLYQVCG